MHKFIRLLMIQSLVLTLLTGCTNIRTKIAYTVYPIGYIIERIAGNYEQYQSIQATNVTIQQASIDDSYEQILKTGKVIFHIGDLEPYYSTHQTQIKKSGIQEYDLSSHNTVYPFARFVKESNEEGIVYKTVPYYENSAFDSIDTYEKDLFLWLDPITMLSMATDIKDYLCNQNPANTSIYEANFATLEEDLINIDAQYQNLANSLQENDEQIRFVSMTASFNGWQKAYGFEVYPVMLSRFGALPNAEQLEIIEKRIQEDDVKYIAYEANMNDELQALYEKVKEDCQLIRVDISNLSSLADDESNAGKDYISISYQNLKALESIVESKQS